MTKAEMATLIKQNLKINDDSRDLAISDVIIMAMNYCNITDLPEEMEPILRKKISGIIDFEVANGTGYQKEIASIKEGDGTITYASGGSNSRDSVYGLADDFRSDLKRFRRLRGYRYA